jgi:molecular chaperone HscB
MYHPDLDALERLHFDSQHEDGVRPLPDAPPDYFAVFALPRRLQLHLEDLRAAWLDLSRRFHPDYHAGASQAVRDEVLHRTALLNNAWKVLRDPILRAEYLLALLAPGLSSDKNAVPPELLEEIFDIQEAGEELRAARLSADAEQVATVEARIAPLRAQALAARQQLEQRIQELARRVDEVLDQGDSADRVLAELKGLRLALDRSNYLRTVLRNLK